MFRATSAYIWTEAVIFGMEQMQTRPEKPHLLRLEGRTSFLAEGVEEVLSYDESAVVAAGGFGKLVLQGKQLRILSFDRAGGRLCGEGEIESVHYVGDSGRRQSLLGKLLR